MGIHNSGEWTPLDECVLACSGQDYPKVGMPQLTLTRTARADGWCQGSARAGAPPKGQSSCRSFHPGRTGHRRCCGTDALLVWLDPDGTHRLAATKRVAAATQSPPSAGPDLETGARNACDSRTHQRWEACGMARPWSESGQVCRSVLGPGSPWLCLGINPWAFSCSAVVGLIPMVGVGREAMR
jgi:hypothetical protein